MRPCTAGSYYYVIEITMNARPLASQRYEARKSAVFPVLAILGHSSRRACAGLRTVPATVHAAGNHPSSSGHKSPPSSLLLSFDRALIVAGGGCCVESCDPFRTQDLDLLPQFDPYCH